MDPITISVTISSLIIAVEQIVVVMYMYGNGIKGAKEEIKRLCSEFLALKAALEHPGSYSAFYSPHVRTDEFSSTLSTTEYLIHNITRRFKRAPGCVNAALHSLVWPWKENDVMEEVQQLERLQSPLMQGLLTVVELLLDYGADPDFRNRKGNAPLKHAIQGRDEACCAALVRAGANTTNVDGKGLDVITIPRRTHELGEKQSNVGDEQRTIEEG